MIWLKIAWGFIAGKARKMSPKHMIFLAAMVFVLIVYFKINGAFKDLSEDKQELNETVSELTKKVSEMQTDNKKILEINKENAKQFQLLQNNYLITDEITDKLIKAVAQSEVKHNETIKIIEQSTDECLKRDLPLPIASSLSEQY